MGLIWKLLVGVQMFFCLVMIVLFGVMALGALIDQFF